MKKEFVEDIMLAEDKIHREITMILQLNTYCSCTKQIFDMFRILFESGSELDSEIYETL
jgi:hypothetical protein